MSISAPGICYCRGDPHCKPFDTNDTMLLVGACIHTLAKDGCSIGQDYDTYHVYANFDRKKPQSHRSFVSQVYVEYKLESGGIVVRLTLLSETP